MSDELYSQFDKTLYRTGSAVYESDGNPITDISTLPIQNVGDGYPINNSEMVQGAWQSANFETNSTGWKLTPTSGEFNFPVSVDSLDIPDTITANSFHVNTAGDTWWGATTLGTSVASVTKAGVGTFSNVLITGGNIGSVTAMTVESTGLNVGTTGHIRGGQTDFDTGTGWFAGYSGAAYKFSFGNSAGNKITWDGSTLVITSDKLPFPTTDIAYVEGTATFLRFVSTSNATGTVFYITHINSASTTTAKILRIAKDSITNNYVITHTTTLTVDAGSSIGIAVIGSYVYVSAVIGAANTLRRYVAADLTGVTTFTFSGTTTNGIMFASSTDLYITATGNSDYYRYTLSGTTATNAETMTYTSAGNTQACISDGTSVWLVATTFALGTNSVIYKYPIAGGASTGSTTLQIAMPAYGGDGSYYGFFMANSVQLGIAFPYYVSSASAVVGTIAKLLAITTP
jgi:hypothetical protein